MIDLGIDIISTKMDYKLATNRSYNNKVRNALKKIKTEYYLTKDHCIACYDDHVRIYKNRNLVLIQEF